MRQEGGHPQPVLHARRSFKASGLLYCQFQVFGAAADPKSAPRVEASYVLRRARGAVVRRSTPTLIAASPGGPVMRFLGLSLEGLEGGDYELALLVEDKESGQKVERVESLRIENAGAS